MVCLRISLPNTSLLKDSNPRDDSSRLKWEGIRCLLEDAQSDILLLLDTCAVADGPAAGSHGIKQCIAAYSPEQAARESGIYSFTYHLIEALSKLATGRPFSVQRLHEEIIAFKHNTFLQHNLMTNGAGKVASTHERLPICFNLTSGSLQSIALSPLVPGAQGVAQLGSPLDAIDSTLQGSKSIYDDKPAIRANMSADLTFEEKRALVCTTFLGEPSQDMASFKHWLQSTPVAAAKIAVEGMFHGPPTILLVSMPIAVWNVVAADRTCCFLGYVNSHNMTTEYYHLVGAVSPLSKAATTSQLEDGKILLEAREAAALTPVMVRNEPFRQDGVNSARQGSIRQDSMRRDSMAMSTPVSGPQILFGEVGSGGTDTGEDSVEMHEAAEQLKLLSHVRHLNQDNGGPNDRSHLVTTGDSPVVHDESTSPDRGEMSVEEQLYNSEYNTSASRPKPRRSIAKQGPKQDTRCSLCSHAPFKDSSSLRKHIAAAHTRPFPCAFAFAGCPSTFGSKNEWKRHIASQHLCLTYYRCSSCSQSTVEGKGNEFNRKDLFTQHLRRMHAPFAIKKALAKGDSKLQMEWESHVKEMQATCLVSRRSPPQRSACPKPDCSSVFEGAGSWDDWTEHVGRHMEKGEAGRLGIDLLLARWALDEGIIEVREDGEYRLCGGGAGQGGGDISMGGFYGDGNGHMIGDANGLGVENGIENGNGNGQGSLLGKIYGERGEGDGEGGVDAPLTA